jgi:hypothetical protein
MTENSLTNEQSCQANQDCAYQDIGQTCSEEQICIFECDEDNDCPLDGKCSPTSYTCDWSGEPVPPSPPSNTNSTHNLVVAAADAPTASGGTTTELKVGSPLVVTIIIVTTLVSVCGLAVMLFFICRRKRLAESSRGLKPLYLSGGSRSSSSLKRSKKDPREKESRSSKKSHQYDDDMYGLVDEGKEKEEPFEESFSQGAVGSGVVPHQPYQPRVPQRSYTMWGSSSPSTQELNVTDYSLQPQHHFMQSESEYPDDNNFNDDGNYKQPQQQ